MKEIELLYENAGIKPIDFAELGTIDFTGTIEIKGKRYFDFTPEKQLELTKWLSKRCFYIEISEMMDKSYGIAFKYQPADEYKNEQSECCVNKNFAEALAESINYIWQDLTEEEKEQVKGTLE